MNIEFSTSDIKRIAKVLRSKPQQTNECIRFEVGKEEHGRKLSLEIYRNIPIGERKGHLISVYTPTAHLQLHFCTAYVVSSLLGEVTFVGETNGKISGLTIEREGGCSLYANVDRSTVSGNFTTLGPEVILSSIALSLTEFSAEESKRKKSASKKGSRSKRS